MRQRTDPLSKAELIDIVDMWVELALELGETELRRMDCLARHQERRPGAGLTRPALAGPSASDAAPMRGEPPLAP